MQSTLRPRIKLGVQDLCMQASKGTQPSLESAFSCEKGHLIDTLVLPCRRPDAAHIPAAHRIGGAGPLHAG